MRRILIIVVIGLLATAALADEPADTPDARRAAAERYAAVYDLKKILGDTADAMSVNMKPEQRKLFRELMLNHVRADWLQAAMMAAMVKNFTAQELNALADFYGSDIGKSAIAKMGPYVADVMPLVQTEMARAAEELQRDEAARKSLGGT